MNFRIENLFYILKNVFMSSENLLPLHGCCVFSAALLYITTCTWVVMGEYCCVDLQLIFEEHLLSTYIFINYIFLIICCTLSINVHVFHMVCCV